uniref:Uncharacterized protein n=1 Tax=Anguilla anguilla TaxID=7936 RepID=A0A0E9V9M8_ANGAN
MLRRNNRAWPLLVLLMESSNQSTGVCRSLSVPIELWFV